MDHHKHKKHHKHEEQSELPETPLQEAALEVRDLFPGTGSLVPVCG